jgi:hypothetical protein
MPDPTHDAHVPEVPEEDEPGVEQHRIGSDRSPRETVERHGQGEEDAPPPAAPTL